MCLWELDNYYGMSFRLWTLLILASINLRYCCYPLPSFPHFGCLSGCNLISVVWEGWGCHMWCCLVAIVQFTSRWEDLHPDSSTFLCVYRADCSVCVCLCTWLLSAMSYCLNPPFSSGTITQADTFRQILVLLLQVFLYLKSEWWSRDKFSHCDDLLWSFSLLLVYEYLNHKT